MTVSLSMLPNFLCSFESLINLSSIYFHHELYFHKLSNEVQIIQCLALKLSNCNAVCTVFESFLMIEYVNDLYFSFEP